jgi:hypothetical protein
VTLSSLVIEKRRFERNYILHLQESRTPSFLKKKAILFSETVAYPGIFFGGGGSTNSVERGQRERESGGGSPIVRGSAGSCNLAQEISFHIVNLS